MVKATRYLNLLKKFKRFFKQHIIKTVKHKMVRIEEHDRNSTKQQQVLTVNVEKTNLQS